MERKKKLGGRGRGRGEQVGGQGGGRPRPARLLFSYSLQKKFYWDVPNEEMRQTFFTQAGNHIRDVFKGHRRRKTVLPFLTKEQWNNIEHLRLTDESRVRHASTNKRNRSSQRAIDAGVYRGGSRNVSKWADEMERTEGTRPLHVDVVKKLWGRPDGTMSGIRSANYENFVNLHSNHTQNEPLSADDDNGGGTNRKLIDPVLEKKSWIEASDGPRNGRIFGMGEVGKALIRTGMVSTIVRQGQPLPVNQEAQLQPLQEEIKEIRSVLVDLVQQQQQFQNSMLQQLLKLQGGQNVSSSSDVPASNAGSTANPL